MTGRGQVPGGWTDPEPRAFSARSGDTVPGFTMPGHLPPDHLPPDHLPPGYAQPGYAQPGYAQPGYAQPGYAEPGYAQGGYTRPGHTPPRPPRPRRLCRLIRRTVALLGILVFLGAGGFAVLLLVTPPASRAQALARAQDRSHGIAYPGLAVPARFAAALVATEDHRFYSDPGIDPIAVGRVAVGYLTGHGSQQGGATLTQQLAKMLYTPNGSGLASEAEQVALAVKLNVTYSKAQILQMYADVAYFGQNHYSLGAASCGYFAVPPARLSWTQAALLAGLVQAPSAYDPLTHPVLAHEREAHVLGRLAATGTLTGAQARAALARPLHLVPPRLARAAPAPGTPTCGKTRT
jgi:membrane peptidoglycan carboxypeptidase